MKNSGRKTVKGRTTSAPMVAKAAPAAKVGAQNGAQNGAQIGTQNGAQIGADTRAVAPTREQIAKRSYELFLDGDGQHGHHEEHWLQAERELSA